MSWRISIKHTSEYLYESDVVASYNEARMSPLSSPTQTVIESALRVIPHVSTYKYFDYWGSLVHAFDIHESHRKLKITSTALVETSKERPLDHDVTWSDLLSSEVAEVFAEYYPFTYYVSESPDFQEIAQELRALPSPSHAVERACDSLRDSLTYLPGSTSVSGTALDAWVQRSGVCQDFAHLALALFRYLGIPSRYASGYLYPLEDAEVGDQVIGASHAWVEVWLGKWYPFDPTNGALVGERHITVARGRDYADVKPFAGIYHGGALESLNVTVELIRLA